MTPRNRLLVISPLLALAAACSATPDSSPVVESASRTDTLDPIALFEDGFKVVTSEACSANPTSQECAVAVLEESGAMFGPSDVRAASASGIFDFTLGLRDQKKIGDCAGNPNDCYTIYVFPSSIGNRDYEEMGKQMREYSKLVGTLLKRDAKGPGEESWLNYHRSRAYSAVRRASRQGTAAFCGEVVKSFIDSLVPEGSDFRQYGNCGEGGHVGACLATKAGFGDEEIRVCASDNDHFFAMVKAEDPAKKWCILDRWSLVNSDNYACEVDWDKAKRVVTYQDQPVAQKWFEDVTCVTLKKYLQNGAGVY